MSVSLATKRSSHRDPNRPNLIVPPSHFGPFTLVTPSLDCQLFPTPDPHRQHSALSFHSSSLEYDLPPTQRGRAIESRITIRGEPRPAGCPVGCVAVRPTGSATTLIRAQLCGPGAGAVGFDGVRSA